MSSNSVNHLGGRALPLADINGTSLPSVNPSNLFIQSPPPAVGSPLPEACHLLEGGGIPLAVFHLILGKTSESDEGSGNSSQSSLSIRLRPDPSYFTESETHQVMMDGSTGSLSSGSPRGTPSESSSGMLEGQTVSLRGISLVRCSVSPESSSSLSTHSNHSDEQK